MTEYVLLNDTLGMNNVSVWAVPLEGGQPILLRVDGQLQVGLRRQIIPVIDGSSLVIDAQRANRALRFAEWTPELVEAAIGHHVQPNSWCYNIANPKYEATTPEQVAALVRRLEDMCKLLPFEVKVTAVQRRFLLYYSDGDKRTQERYLRLVTAPGKENPYDREWELVKRFRTADNAYGRPLLYEGPAWVTRFTVNGVDPIVGCRVYVDDEGRFICSDWCQRTGHSTYQRGIDLQVSGYTFDSWIAGPCMQQGSNSRLLPKGTTIVNLNQVNLQQDYTRDLDPGLFASIDFIHAAYLSGAKYKYVEHIFHLAKVVLWTRQDLAVNNLPLADNLVFSCEAGQKMGIITDKEGNTIPVDRNQLSASRIDKQRITEQLQNLMLSEIASMPIPVPIDLNWKGLIALEPEPSEEPPDMPPALPPMEIGSIPVVQASWGDIEAPVINIKAITKNSDLLTWKNLLDAYKDAFEDGSVAPLTPTCGVCGDVMILHYGGDWWQCKDNEHKVRIPYKYNFYISCKDCDNIVQIPGSVNFGDIAGAYPCPHCENITWGFDAYDTL